MIRIHRAIEVFLFFILVLIIVCSPSPDFSVHESLPYNNLFNKESGWTGADGAYSISLGDHKILWVFGDTWIGRVHNNKHIDSVLINNSIAVQNGLDPSNASIRFFYGKTKEGKPTALIQPDDGKGWFWIYHGIMNENGLFLFLIQIDRVGDRSSPGFKIIGTWLGHVRNPHHPPDTWNIKQTKIPYEILSPSGDTIFGSSLLHHNGFIYIYGTSEDIQQGTHRKFMILARTRATSIAAFKNWEFFSNGKWVNHFKSSSRLCPEMANEYSVSYLPAFGTFVVVYTENSVSKNIRMRTAPEPSGPWSDPVTLCTCPEVTWDDGIYCYAAKAHSALTTAPDELIISYIANSNDFWKMAADARLYRPRFLKVKFSGARALHAFD